MIETTIEQPILPPVEPFAAPVVAAAPEPPLARPRPRAKPVRAVPAMEFPQLAHGWTFPPDDALPILPDPPRPRATYEDRSGELEL
jgi:hypothetical protein